MTRTIDQTPFVRRIITKDQTDDLAALADALGVKMTLGWGTRSGWVATAYGGGLPTALRETDPHHPYQAALRVLREAKTAVRRAEITKMTEGERAEVYGK